MQIPTDDAPDGELRWLVATVVAAALCIGVAPLLPVAWAAGRWGHGGGR